jgi:hypothetical protein
METIVNNIGRGRARRKPVERILAIPSHDRSRRTTRKPRQPTPRLCLGCRAIGSSGTRLGSRPAPGEACLRRGHCPGQGMPFLVFSRRSPPTGSITIPALGAQAPAASRGQRDSLAAWRAAAGSACARRDRRSVKPAPYPLPFAGRLSAPTVANPGSRSLAWRASPPSSRSPCASDSLLCVSSELPAREAVTIVSLFTSC